MSGLSNVIAIAAGSFHTLALKSDGRYGRGDKILMGRLGGKSTMDKLTPVQVSGLTGVIAIAAGEYHSLALKSDSTVWAWGRNNYGQLGDGTNRDRTSPVQVSGLSGIIAIAAGTIHSIAMKNNGTVWTWGENKYGQLGDNTIMIDRLTPVQVVNSSGVGFAGAMAIAAGGWHTLAIKTDNTVWAWGRNDYGQLGRQFNGK